MASRKELIRRALKRQRMGRGGAATARRLGEKPFRIGEPRRGYGPRGRARMPSRDVMVDPFRGPSARVHADPRGVFGRKQTAEPEPVGPLPPGAQRWVEPKPASNLQRARERYKTGLYGQRTFERLKRAGDVVVDPRFLAQFKPGVDPQEALRRALKARLRGR